MEDKMLYKDPSQPVDVRVEDLLSRMTLEEKAAQLCGDLAASFIVDGKLSHEALKEKFKDGHGRITQEHFFRLRLMLDQHGNRNWQKR